MNCFELHISSKAGAYGQIFLYSVKVRIRSAELNDIKLRKSDYILKKKMHFSPISFLFFSLRIVDIIIFVG